MSRTNLEFKNQWLEGSFKPAIVDPYRNHWFISPTIYQLQYSVYKYYCITSDTLGFLISHDLTLWQAAYSYVCTFIRFLFTKVLEQLNIAKSKITS